MNDHMATRPGKGKEPGRFRPKDHDDPVRKSLKKIVVAVEPNSSAPMAENLRRRDRFGFPATRPLD